MANRRRHEQSVGSVRQVRKGASQRFSRQRIDGSSNVLGNGEDKAMSV